MTVQVGECIRRNGSIEDRCTLKYLLIIFHIEGYTSLQSLHGIVSGTQFCLGVISLQLFGGDIEILSDLSPHLSIGITGEITVFYRLTDLQRHAEIGVSRCLGVWQTIHIGQLQVIEGTQEMSLSGNMCHQFLISIILGLNLF